MMSLIELFSIRNQNPQERALSINVRSSSINVLEYIRIFFSFFKSILSKNEVISNFK